MLVTSPPFTLVSAEITWLQSRRTISSTASTAKPWVERAYSVRRAFEQARQIDHRDHLTADIGHAKDRRAGAHHGRHGRHDEDFTDLEDVDAEQFGLSAVCRIAKSEQQQLELVVVGQVGALVDVPHRAGHAVAPLAW